MADPMAYGLVDRRDFSSQPASQPATAIQFVLPLTPYRRARNPAAPHRADTTLAVCIAFVPPPSDIHTITQQSQPPQQLLLHPASTSGVRRKDILGYRLMPYRLALW